MPKEMHNMHHLFDFGVPIKRFLIFWSLLGGPPPVFGNKQMSLIPLVLTGIAVCTLDNAQETDPLSDPKP